MYGNLKNCDTTVSIRWVTRFCLAGLAAFFCIWASAQPLNASGSAIHITLQDSTSDVKETERPGNGISSRESVLVMERAIARYTNEERAKKGLATLEPSPALSFLAKGQSRNMCKIGRLIHESDQFPSGWKKFDQRLKQVRLLSGGENIAYQTALKGTDRWARLIVQGWMNSPRHRKNILNSTYKFLGVGLHPCSNKIIYATQVFSSEIGRIPE